MKSLIAILATALVAFLVGTWFGIALVSSKINDTASQNCASVNTLDGALLSILDRSFKGLPSNPYYKAHPEQLSKALRQTAQAVNDLQAARCTQ